MSPSMASVTLGRQRYGRNAHPGSFCSIPALSGDPGPEADPSHRETHGEKNLQETYTHLEQRVRERTTELQRVVNLIAGREIRMEELRGVITQLRAQLKHAGLKPAADDPLAADTED